MRPGREHDITALRHHDILPLLNTWTDDDLRVLGDLSYEGESDTITIAFKKPKNRPAPPSSSNVLLCPWTIGQITAAALVILHIEHARTT